MDQQPSQVAPKPTNRLVLECGLANPTERFSGLADFGLLLRAHRVWFLVLNVRIDSGWLYRLDRGFGWFQAGSLCAGFGQGQFWFLFLSFHGFVLVLGCKGQRAHQGLVPRVGCIPLVPLTLGSLGSVHQALFV